MEPNADQPKAPESKPPQDEVAKEVTADVTRHVHLEDEDD